MKKGIEVMNTKLLGAILLAVFLISGIVGSELASGGKSHQETMEFLDAYSTAIEEGEETSRPSDRANEGENSLAEKSRKEAREVVNDSDVKVSENRQDKDNLAPSTGADSPPGQEASREKDGEAVEGQGEDLQSSPAYGTAKQLLEVLRPSGN